MVAAIERQQRCHRSPDRRSIRSQYRPDIENLVTPPVTIEIAIALLVGLALAAYVVIMIRQEKR
ncbi:hypothetical protein [Nocardia lijiangensis]|uniref:hypothetical protein n=1 Tax=Nocardia lijiangensis TaxID=299618 RepID=UPI003D721F76